MRTTTPSSRPGTTLPEALIALALLGILATLTAPTAKGALDVYAARSARDAAAAVLSRSRTLALARGSAEVRVDLDRARMALASPVTAAADTTDIGRMLAVTIASDTRSSGVVVLRFDALGIGRFANHTLRFRRGSAEARLTLSSYGRPRRW